MAAVTDRTEKSSMIGFEEARERVLDGVEPVTGTEPVAVGQCLGRVLAGPAVAVGPIPNHDNSAMDGYALRHGDLAPDRETEFTVVADLPAGARLTTAIGAGQAVRIMTGAPIPEGCDCVVKQEDVTREAATLRVPPGQKPGQHVRRAGEDVAAGTEVLPRGRRLGAVDIGVLTSLGLARVEVVRRPRVAVLSTGNEVTPPGQPLAPGHVYDSNRLSLLASLEALRVEVIDLGLVRDDRAAITEALRVGGEKADAVISSGGVSVGDFDLVKEALSESGHIEFWKVAMKPGKPQAYGRLGKAAFFGLPGNPVSALVVFALMVRPALLKLMGAVPEPDRWLRLPVRGGVSKRKGRREFQRGVVHFAAEGAWVESVGGQGSAVLSGLARANALLVLPEGEVTLRDGDVADVWLLDPC